MSLGFKKNWPRHVDGFNRHGMPTGSNAGEWIVPVVPKADDEETVFKPKVTAAMSRLDEREMIVGEGVGYVKWDVAAWDPDARPGKKKLSGE
jgi:hypothetical protein